MAQRKKKKGTKKKGGFQTSKHSKAACRQFAKHRMTRGKNGRFKKKKR